MSFTTRVLTSPTQALEIKKIIRIYLCSMDWVNWVNWVLSWVTYEEHFFCHLSVINGCISLWISTSCVFAHQTCLVKQWKLFMPYSAIQGHIGSLGVDWNHIVTFKNDALDDGIVGCIKTLGWSWCLVCKFAGRSILPVRVQVLREFHAGINDSGQTRTTSPDFNENGVPGILPKCLFRLYNIYWTLLNPWSNSPKKVAPKPWQLGPESERPSGKWLPTTCVVLCSIYLSSLMSFPDLLTCACGACQLQGLLGAVRRLFSESGGWWFSLRHSNVLRWMFITC